MRRRGVVPTCRRVTCSEDENSQEKLAQHHPSREGTDWWRERRRLLAPGDRDRPSRELTQWPEPRRGTTCRAPPSHHLPVTVAGPRRIQTGFRIPVRSELRAEFRRCWSPTQCPH